MSRVLRNGVANRLTFDIDDVAGAPATGLNVSFYVVLVADNIDTGPKIGGQSYSCQPVVGTPGRYAGDLPYAASLTLLPSKKYRVVPVVADQFRGGDSEENVFSVDYA